MNKSTAIAVAMLIAVPALGAEPIYRDYSAHCIYNNSLTNQKIDVPMGEDDSRCETVVERINNEQVTTLNLFIDENAPAKTVVIKHLTNSKSSAHWLIDDHPAILTSTPNGGFRGITVDSTVVVEWRYR